MATLDFGVKEQTRLRQAREQIAHKLSQLQEFMMQREVDIEPDECDAEIFEREMAAALIAAFGRKLQDIDFALGAVEKGRYGICNRCNQPIGLARLEAKPDALFCIGCQKELERLAGRNQLIRRVQW